MACDCSSRSPFLNLEVKYSFTFVDPENLRLVLRSIFETPERIIQDCEGIFRIESDEFYIEKPILRRRRDADNDDSFLDGSSDDGMWKSLSSRILEGIESTGLKHNIEIYLDFKVLECVEIKYR